MEFLRSFLLLSRLFFLIQVNCMMFIVLIILTIARRISKTISKNNPLFQINYFFKFLKEIYVFTHFFLFLKKFAFSMNDVVLIHLY